MHRKSTPFPPNPTKIYFNYLYETKQWLFSAESRDLTTVHCTTGALGLSDKDA